MGTRSVYILAAARTPICRHRGGLAPVRPDDLLALAMSHTVKAAQLPADRIDEVVMGCANQAGEDNRNVARISTLLAGLPESVPAITVNRLCASGLSAVNMAARQILCGEAELVLAGGVESMSRAPLVMSKGEESYARGNRTVYDSALGWRFPNPKLEAMFPLEAMGETAENVVEQFAISREDQDAFAFQSHQRALAAEAEGAFADERIPVSIPQRKGNPVIIDKDEGPRSDTTLEKLASLRAVFRKNGTVTAGNASSLNDGAACVVLASDTLVNELKIDPLARWVGSASAGVNPRTMGIGPVPAVQKLIQRTGAKLSEVDLFELNEAFAGQALAVIRQLGLQDRLSDINPLGGAIALGHPLGMSGARILTTLMHSLRRTGKKRGIATLCVGVGQGVATLVERP